VKTVVGGRENGERIVDVSLVYGVLRCTVQRRSEGPTVWVGGRSESWHT
jgi:hypothetical protein